MRDGVGFESTRLVEGLRTTAERHEFFEPVAGSTGFASEAAATRNAMGGGDAIQGARAVVENFLIDGGFQGSVAGLVAVQPERQGLLETRAARLLAVPPNPDDDGRFFLGVGCLGTSSSSLLTKADLAVEGLDRVLAIPAQYVADFVNHCASPCSISVRIPRSAAL